MPRKSKIASGERLNWLERSEGGESVPKIAHDSGRDVRSVRAHIEKARHQRNFELARRDALKEALQGHQQDMLGLLQNLRESINVPELDYGDSVGLDFGLEDLWRPSDLVQNRETILPRFSTELDVNDDQRSLALVKVIRDIDGPQEIQLDADTSRLWRALKEHIRQDAVWRHEAAWRKALLDELQRRAELNRAIRRQVEEIFGLSVCLRSRHKEPWLAPETIRWIRTRLTKISLGTYVPPVDEELTETSPGSLRTRYGQDIAVNIGDAEAHIQSTLAAMEGHGDVIAAARSFERLQALTENVHDAIDEYLLIHYIPGLCSLCQKLGGQ